MFVCRRYSDFVELNKKIQRIGPGREFKNKLPGTFGEEGTPEFRKKVFEKWLNEIIMVYFQGDYTDMIGILNNPENLELRQKMLIRKIVNTFLHEPNWEYADPPHIRENSPPDPQPILDAGRARDREAQPRAGGGATLEGAKQREAQRNARLDQRELTNVGA